MILSDSIETGKRGSVATLHLRDVPLCCSHTREIEEGRHDRFQGEPIGAEGQLIRGYRIALELLAAEIMAVTGCDPLVMSSHAIFTLVFFTLYSSHSSIMTLL